MADEKTGTPPGDSPEPQLSALEQVEARREARKAAARKAADDALAVDLEAIDAIEVQLGDDNVGVMRVGYTPGLPVAAAVRCPKPAELKRFRDRVKPGQKDGRNRDVSPDTAKACEELADVCLVYPTDRAVYAKLCEARPGLAAQLGSKAVDLAVAAEDAAGKGSGS
jgi:hypothetical protein